MRTFLFYDECARFSIFLCEVFMRKASFNQYPKRLRSHLRLIKNYTPKQNSKATYAAQAPAAVC